MSTIIQQPEVYSDRPSWLRARPSFLGASETAAILGLGYADQSLITIYESKVNGCLEEEEVKRLKIGALMEPVLRQLFEDETGFTVRYKPFDIRRHPKYPFMGATLDGECTDDDGLAVCELKNV